MINRENFAEKYKEKFYAAQRRRLNEDIEYLRNYYLNEINKNEQGKTSP
jgi:hypothetical protein